MKYLLDTNVLSETIRTTPHPGVIEWLRRHEDGLAMDSIILGEIYYGIQVLSPGNKKHRLEKWFGVYVQNFDCLPWDDQSAMCWGELMAQLKVQGKTMPLKDSYIAASALRHGLILATRNVADFKLVEVSVVNPFEV